MPENSNPATQAPAGTTAEELDFTKANSDNPRIKRRSLKGKQAGLSKPPATAVSAARELEKEAPPIAPDAPKPAPIVEPVQENKPRPVAKTEIIAAPPRTTPAATTPASPSASATPAPGAAAPLTAAKTNVSAPQPATPSASPHGTRPATLYYSTSATKAQETSPMKTISTVRPSSATSTTPASSTNSTRPAASATPAAAKSSPESSTSPSSTRPAATTTPAIAATTSRPAAASAGSFDYRANVERQSREQKTVGSILSYIVYALIALFVLTAGLAGYGASVIFKQLHDESVTVSDLDQRYAAANKDLTAKLQSTQDALSLAQAQVARDHDMILKQQDDINKLIGATGDNAAALKAEKAARLLETQARQQEAQTRAEEVAGLRARVRDLEYKNTQQKF